ncbi:response regulator [soil metagenome]
MKVLIVEDNPEKARVIFDFVAANISLKDEDVVCCGSLFDARRILSKDRCDVLILDLVLPDRMGYPPKPEGGITLLKEIAGSDRLSRPAEIICCSEHVEVIEQFKDFLDTQLVHLITYEENGQRWKIQLGNRIRYIAEAKRSESAPPEVFDYDVALVTSAPHVEIEAVLKLGTFKTVRNDSDAAVYYESEWVVGGRVMRIVATAAPAMGMIAAGMTTSKLIARYRPRFCFMTGIAAGIQGKNQLGDILMAESAFDYGSGKIKRVGNQVRFDPDPKVINVDQRLQAELQSIELDQAFMFDLWNSWRGEKPPVISRCVRGPFTSGAAVVQDPKLIRSIVGRNRKLIGLDMEVYGFFYACDFAPIPKPRFLAVKGICDFADKKKDDRFQSYAAYMSAEFVKRIIVERLSSWRDYGTSSS